VEEVLRAVANMADAQVEQVFQGISLMPQISSSVLGKMSELFTDLFQHSRDLSSEEELRPRQKSNRLKPQTAAIGTRQSARRKAAAAIKQGVDKGKQTNSDSDYVAEKEEDRSGTGDQSKSSGALEEEPGTKTGLKEVTRPKRTASKKVNSHGDNEPVF
jgi:hypothetical protein